MKSISLKIKIQGLIALVTLMFFLGFAAYFYQIQKKEITNTQNYWFTNQVGDLSKFVDIQIAGNQKNVNSAMIIGHHIFYANGNTVTENPDIKVELEATNQITKKKHTVTLNHWSIAGEPIHNSFTMVDRIKDLTVETVTIFQKIDAGFLRISTNVMKLNGKRAVGTYIPMESPVIQTCLSGKTYYGRAFVVNDWYLTAYEPIFIDGEVKGILYVGVKAKKLDELNQFFSNKQNFSTSSNFLIEEAGTVLIHSKKSFKIKNVKDQIFFKLIKEATKKEGRQEFTDKNETKIIQFYKYNKTIKSYIVFNIEKTEFDRAISHLFMAILVGGFIITALLLIINGLVLNLLFKNLKKLSLFSKKISEGQLDYKLDYDKDNEIGRIGSSLRHLLGNYKSLVAIIRMISEGDLEQANQLARTTLAKSNKEDNALYNSLTTMLQALNKIIKDIQISTTNIIGTNSSVKNVANMLTSGANVQASSAEEVSTSMEEMVAIINQTAENAQEADAIAVNAAKGVKESKESFKLTMQAMQEIAEKISIIGKIAEKTDILAVNAAIEAARAGEEGKGFAIVAQEIRKLAENSKLASSEINKVVDTSLTSGRESTAMLEFIVPEIEKTARLVQAINNASKEQNAGVMQINNAVQELSKIIQENTTAATVISQGNKSMEKQVETLAKSVTFFNVKIGTETLEDETPIQKEKQTPPKGVNIILTEPNNKLSDDDFESF